MLGRIFGRWNTSCSNGIDIVNSKIKFMEVLYEEDCVYNVIAGDDSSKDHQDWAERNNADEVIVLLFSFDVDSSGGDGSLNPNSTYDDWKWILVRTNGGQWKHVDHGYYWDYLLHLPVPIWVKRKVKFQFIKLTSRILKDML